MPEPSREIASTPHFEKAQRLAKIGSWGYDFTTNVLVCSDLLYDLLGVQPDSALSAYPLQAYIHPDDRYRVEEALAAARTGEGKYFAEHRIVRPDGTVRWVDVRADYEFDEAHDPVRVTGIAADVTERKEPERTAEVALHDALTGLPTRETILTLSRLAVSKAQTTGEELAAFFISCSGVSDVNEAFGHSFGDRLVMQIAARLSAALDGHAALGRWGGQEFLVVAPCDPKEGHHETLRLLQTALERTFMYEGHGVHAFPTIGVSIYPEHGETAEELIRNSDTAMSVARERHLSCELFSWPMHDNARERINIHGGLKSALENEEFVLAYQPIVDSRTNQAMGVEALVRWRHPQRGLLYPDSFIGVAEMSDMIIPLGRWVLREACRAAAGWRDQGMTLFVAVNVSPRQFQNDDLVETIREALHDSNLPAAQLEIELTESGIMEDIERAIHIMKELRDLGVRLSLDDFGTGHSSLARLKRFPINSLKVDRAFVNDMLKSDFDRALVTSIVHLGRSRHLSVIGEGVETEEQFTTLRRLGCTLLQGFCIARPLWRDDVAEFVANRPLRSREDALDEP